MSWDLLLILLVVGGTCIFLKKIRRYILENFQTSEEINFPFSITFHVIALYVHVLKIFNYMVSNAQKLVFSVL